MDQYTTQAPPAPRNGLGTAGLVLGIIAAAIGLVPFLGLVSFLLGPLAIILGAIGWTRTRGQQPKATNPVASMFGVGLGVLGFALAIAMVAGMNAAVDELDRQLGEGNTAPAVDGPAASDPATGDVTVSQCEITDEGFGVSFAEAVVVITNRTDKTQSYLATISVDDQAGDRVGEINAVTNSLAAGQSVTLSGAQTSGNVSEGAQPGPADCTVANVDRFPS